MRNGKSVATQKSHHRLIHTKIYTTEFYRSIYKKKNLINMTTQSPFEVKIWTRGDDSVKKYTIYSRNLLISNIEITNELFSIFHLFEEQSFAPLLALDSFYHFRPQILILQKKVLFWLKNIKNKHFRPILCNWISKFAEKKSANNKGHGPPVCQKEVLQVLCIN